MFLAVLAAAQAVTSPLLLEALTPSPCLAVLNSPNARIPRTVDAALRRSIPAFNAGADPLPPPHIFFGSGWFGGGVLHEFLVKGF
jgi:hypothetical protein